MTKTGLKVQLQDTMKRRAVLQAAAVIMSLRQRLVTGIQPITIKQPLSLDYARTKSQVHIGDTQLNCHIR